MNDIVADYYINNDEIDNVAQNEIRKLFRNTIGNDFEKIVGLLDIRIEQPPAVKSKVTALPFTQTFCQILKRIISLNFFALVYILLER